jgi:hypothetical protein
MGCGSSKGMLMPQQDQAIDQCCIGSLADLFLICHCKLQEWHQHLQQLSP